MTSYSLYGTGRLDLIDGGTALSTDEDKAAEQVWAIAHAIASGAARALLDCTRDEANPDDDQISASQWHSADEGWEIGAVIEGDQLVAIAERFFTENMADVLSLVRRIAWDGRYNQEMWSRDEGYAFYRVGMLLGYTGSGQGIGFEDYALTVPHRTDSVTAHLVDWTERVVRHAWEGTWIDSTEEPCLLHLGA